MNNTGKKLSAPLRVYWDLAGATAGGLDETKSVAVARELASLKVFFAVLKLSHGPVSGLAGIIKALKEGGVRVTLSVSTPESFPGRDAVSLSDGLDLSPNDAQSLKYLINKVDAADMKEKGVSVSVVPEAGGAGLINEMFTIAADAGIRVFSLPNPDLVVGKGRERMFVLDDEDRALVKEAVEEVLKPLGDKARLFVHDLFLHRSIGLPSLAGLVEYAGCQAGDAIAYIDRTGVVYPCSSLPKPLGNLGVCTLKEIWSGMERADIRARIMETPKGDAGCAGCAELAVCKGGCRGLAFAVSGLDSRDPGCSGKRG